VTAAVSCSADLTPEYLTTALGGQLAGRAVTGVRAVPVGTGQVSDSYRLHLSYDGQAAMPRTLVAKIPAADPASRGAARAFRTYEIEASFYGQLAAGLPVSLARCYFAAYEPGPDEYVVLLEDLAPAAPGDQLTGISPVQAAAAVGELAALHAAGWNRADLAALPWLNRSSPDASALMTAVLTDLFPGFRDRYAGRLEPETVSLVEDFLPVAARYLSVGEGQRTIVHGDFRADNLLFGRARPAVLDWQTCSFGPAVGDLSYFLGSSLPVQQRREHERDLVSRYHTELTGRGVHLGLDECWSDYRRLAFNGIVMTIIAAMVVQRTDRGDQMFVAMANRHARHALDLGALALVG
jgi:hypothetical protein